MKIYDAPYAQAKHIQSEKHIRNHVYDIKLFMQLIFPLLTVLAFFTCSPSDKNVKQDNTVLTLLTKIELPNVTGRIDHIAYDSINNLAFVAALGNNSVEVVNIHTKQVIHSIKEVKAPQGLAYIPSLNKLVVANDGDGTVKFFDRNNYKLLAEIDLKDDADNIRYDAEKNLIYAGYGSGGIAIIDAISMKQKATILLDGHPESFQIDQKQNRLYINVPDANEIEVASLNSSSIIAKWKITAASSNFPMALDTVNNRLFIGCRIPPSIKIIDTRTGKDIASVKCSGDADDLFYTNNLLFISAGKGYIDAFKTNDTTLTQISHMTTSDGARTSLLLTSEKRLLLAVPARNNNSAALWLFKVTIK